MKHFILNRFVDRQERFLGVELPYMRQVVTSAPSAMLPIGLFIPASSYGRHVPSDVLNIIRLSATKAQDCGECMQIAVNHSLKAGMSPELLRAAIHGRVDDLSGPLADAFLFGQGVASGLDVTTEREVLRDHFGERGVIEASLAASTSLLFPALKRGMGFALACDIETLAHSLQSEDMGG
ncbi:MAG: hypothetical protein ABFS14_07435 [Gemmatimonadota bacterium]